MRIVADDKIPFLMGVLEPYAEVDYFPGAKINRHTLKNADALITRTRTKVTKKLLKDTTVKLVATATIGYDHIDTGWLTRNEIQWTNAPGCNSTSVMQYIAASLVFLAQKKGFRFKDKTLGIVGVGNVGSKVAQMAEVLGFKVLLNDPLRERKEGKGAFVSLEEIKETANIITFHVPLNKEGLDRTLEMVNTDFFNSLKKTPILINSSRGPVVDGEAFKKAIQTKKVSGAVLDVWNNEPQIDQELVELLDIVTPHIAGYSIDGKANGTAMSVNAVSNFFGFPLRNWSPENLPEPENPLIKINDSDLSMQEILETAIYYTYPIERDDTNLRTNLSDFEKLRGNYPVRREFPAYQIKLKSGNENIYKKLMKLGFKKLLT
ncbi:MAG: 4-phosphoerythronate dehydrogenase [Bacteroidales bacterium]|nr:4-phosphoerythronate dehydrogenase [Bacteroidales bacterium]